MLLRLYEVHLDIFLESKGNDMYLLSLLSTYTWREIDEQMKRKLKMIQTRRKNY